MDPIFRKISVYLTLLLVTAPVFGFDSLEANRKGVAAMKAGRYDEAIRIFTEVLRQSKDDPAAKANLVNLYNGLGLGYEEAGDHAKAREMLDKALKLQPDSANIKGTSPSSATTRVSAATTAGKGRT
jgi:Tetratricopeptide repeat.